MTTWTNIAAPGEVERQVTDLLNHADRSGLAPEAVVAVTARVLCLLALAARPAGASVDQAKVAVMKLAWESLAAFADHPFSAANKAH